VVLKEETQSYNLKEKNVLVAGGSGLVGTNLTKRLITLGVNVLSTFFSKEPPFFKRKLQTI